MTKGLPKQSPWTAMFKCWKRKFHHPFRHRTNSLPTICGLCKTELQCTSAATCAHGWSEILKSGRSDATATSIGQHTVPISPSWILCLGMGKGASLLSGSQVLTSWRSTSRKQEMPIVFRSTQTPSVSKAVSKAALIEEVYIHAEYWNRPYLLFFVSEIIIFLN